MVPEAGIEPARSYDQRILSPWRLPFRHSGSGGPSYLSTLGVPTLTRTSRRKREKRCQYHHSDLPPTPAFGLRQVLNPDLSSVFLWLFLLLFRPFGLHRNSQDLSGGVLDLVHLFEGVVGLFDMPA